MGKNKRNRNKEQPAGGRAFRVPMGTQEVPKAWNPNSPMLRQLGLHSPEGLMRLLTILMHKVDPRGAGIVISTQDLAEAVTISTVQGRANLQVRGTGDAIHLRMTTEAEARVVVKTDNAIQKAQGQPTSPEVGRPQHPVPPPQASA